MINSFLLPNGGHLSAARHWALIFLCLLGWGTAQAQLEPPTDDPGDEEGPTATVTIECDRVCVTFTGISNAPDNRWLFGDGTSATGLSVTHCYKDVDFYTLRWAHRVSPFDPWNYYSFPLQAIFVGEGCGSVRKISDLVAKTVLPSGGSNNRTLYVFGDLDADLNYQFNGCTFNVLPGSVVKVTNRAKLTLNGGSMQPHIPNNCTKQLWNGLEAHPYTELTTMGGLSINYALYGIRPVSSPHTIGPKLDISSTIFDKNFIGICGNSGHFGIGKFQGNTFTGGPIPYGIRFCTSGQLPAGIPYLNWSYAGIYVDGNMRGSLWLPGSAGNTFSNLPVGVYAQHCDVFLTGCTFNNILLSHLGAAMPPSMHGSAVIGKINGYERLFFTNGLNVNTADRGIFVEVFGENNAVNIAQSNIVGTQNGI